MQVYFGKICLVLGLHTLIFDSFYNISYFMNVEGENSKLQFVADDSSALKIRHFRITLPYIKHNKIKRIFR